jgi:hypothetical protein
VPGGWNRVQEDFRKKDMRSKYDTSVIGKEKLLSADFRKKIPYSTISSWRKMDCSKYLGHEFRYHFNDAFKVFEMKSENARLRSLMFGISRSWLSLSYLILPEQLQSGKRLQFKNLRKTFKISAIHQFRSRAMAFWGGSDMNMELKHYVDQSAVNEAINSMRVLR